MEKNHLPERLSGHEQCRASGQRYIPAMACVYPPAIDANDILLVDFDRHEIKYGALYLVEEVKDGKVQWMGCRRFDLLPSGVQIDVTGKGDWQQFIGQAAAHWRIAGEVCEIFKPSLSVRG